MSKDLKNLYSEVIRKLNDDPYHFEKKTDAGVHINADNLICGDRFDVFLDCNGDQITATHFHGFGCAISRASTSVLVKALDGRSLRDAELICDNFLRFINQEPNFNAVILPADHTAFSGVFQFPERIDCATLAWKEMKNFLAKRNIKSKR